MCVKNERDESFRFLCQKQDGRRRVEGGTRIVDGNKLGSQRKFDSQEREL